MQSAIARHLLSAFIALCIVVPVVGGAAGCVALSGSKELTLELDGIPPDQGVVVLEERLRTAGAPDSSAGFRTWVTGCKIISSTRPAPSVLHVPWAVNYGFFWWTSTERVRWTFFTPGHVITTLYPTGVVLKTDYTEVHEPTLMWWDRSWPNWPSAMGTRTRLKERHLRLRQEYPRDADEATVRLAMRPLVPRREELPAGFALAPFPSLPVGLCEADAWNFGQQLRALRRAADDGGRENPEVRIAWATVDQEYRALCAAGLDDHLSEDELRDLARLRALLAN